MPLLSLGMVPLIASIPLQLALCKQRTFLNVNSCYVHFSALLFGNALSDVHQILHVMSILILGGVPDFSMS